MPVIKLTGGSHNRRKIYIPRSLDIRPALSRVRGAIFNILAPKVPNSRFLDLFAGSGSVGFEALSRGASFCLFQDNDIRCTREIERNIALFGFGTKAKALTKDVFAHDNFLGYNELLFDIIFLGPPYKFFTEKKTKGLLIRIIEDILAQRILANEGIILVEHRKNEGLGEIPGQRIFDLRNYGQTEITFYSNHNGRQGI